MSRNGETRLLVTTSAAEGTRALAAALAAELGGGEVLGLRGDLGTGKTVFVQGLAGGLGVSDPVTSPSFVIVHQYRGRRLLCHVDLYRLAAEQVEVIGLEDLIAPDSVVAVEWSERLPQHLRRRLQFQVTIDFAARECERTVEVTALTQAAAEALHRVGATR